MAMNDLDYKIRKKFVNQQFFDLTQLVEKVRHIEQLRAKKERINKGFEQDKIAYAKCVKSDDDFDELHVAELQVGPP